LRSLVASLFAKATDNIHLTDMRQAVIRYAESMIRTDVTSRM